LNEPRAVALSSFVPSERFLTSRPVTVPSLMFLPVTVTAAYAVPPSAANSARYATAVLWLRNSRLGCHWIALLGLGLGGGVRHLWRPLSREWGYAALMRA
jgi:hypothetical protein